MPIRLINGAEFLHIPKTGGKWVSSILKSNNLVLKSYGHIHADYDYNLFSHSPNFPWGTMRSNYFTILNHNLFKFGYRKAPFRFCFVRNPLSWYESWWKYMCGKGWKNWGDENSARHWYQNYSLAILNQGFPLLAETKT